MTGPDAGRVVVLDVIGLQPEHVTADRTPELHALLEEVAPTVAALLGVEDAVDAEAPTLVNDRDGR